LCFFLWAAIQFLVSFLCIKIPNRYFDPARFPFAPFGFEKNGAFYRKWLLVHKWKKYLPDGGALMGADFRKKNLEHVTGNNLQRFLVESCRAEMTHLLAIVPFWVFGFIAPPEVIWIMLIYAVAINLPCIVAQRYNRPRILTLIGKRYRNSYGVVLFETAHDAIIGEKKIRDHLQVALMPIPRQFSAGCGIVLRFEPGDEPQIRELLRTNQIQGRIEFVSGSDGYGHTEPLVNGGGNGNYE
jgi:glycosyl-4,4'-diaponeurosporenoate acyltransferase